MAKNKGYTCDVCGAQMTDEKCVNLSMGLRPSRYIGFDRYLLSYDFCEQCAFEMKKTLTNIVEKEHKI